MNLARGARIALAFALVGLSGTGGSVAGLGSIAPAGTWAEVSWPFLLDQWGGGRAFRCEGASCPAGAALLYVRTKRGFCNCVTGVADDDEVDRLSDFEFFGGEPRPLGSGRAISLGNMSGRVRAFMVGTAHPQRRLATSLVVSTDCEALVATLISESNAAIGVETSVLDLLGRDVLANLP